MSYMTNLLIHNKLLYAFPNGNVRENGYCVFDKSTIKHKDGLLSITPTYQDTEGWYATIDQYKTVKRGIKSGLAIIDKPVYYGLYMINIDFQVFSQALPSIGLISDDATITFFSHNGNSLFGIGRYYASLNDNENVYTGKRILRNSRNVNILVAFRKNFLSIAYNGTNVLTVLGHDFDKPFKPYMYLDIDSPYIPLDNKKSLTINSFYYEP